MKAGTSSGSRVAGSWVGRGRVAACCQDGTSAAASRRTGRDRFRASGSPAFHFRDVRSGRQAWIVCWQTSHTTRDFRCRLSIWWPQEVSACPPRWRSMRRRSKCISTWSSEPHSSQVFAKSRNVSVAVGFRTGGYGGRGEGHIHPPHERYRSPGCDQRPLPPFSLDDHPEDPPGSSWPVDDGSESPVDLANADVQLGRKGLGHRVLHHPLHPSELVEVEGELVVLDEPPVLSLEPSNDLVGRVVDPLRPMDRLSVSHVGTGTWLARRPLPLSARSSR